MPKLRRLAALLPAASLLILTACGGGSGQEGLALTPPPPAPAPPPPPSPPPAAAEPIDISASPATQEFTTLTPGDPEDGIRIRYNATNRTYEVMPGDSSVWRGLRAHHSYSSTPNHYFAFGPTDVEQMSFFFTFVSHLDPGNEYQYSNIAIWGDKVGAYWDDAYYTAFGMATPAGGVPAAVGPNGFNGVFAGPAAQEVMGRWNLPFVLPSDGKTYDAWGAFIGKR